MAQRIQNKRSSIAGKRPEGRYLEPGEIALNTNALDSGVYFETNDGSIAKAGPTFPGINPPISEVGYGNGEAWLDTGNQTFNTYSTAVDEWIPALSPFFGGSTTAIFVGTEFPEATDDLSNDGKARPFASINRACLEVARRSILRNRQDDPLNNRFSIMLLPGRNVVHNEPGTEVNSYVDNSVKFTENQSLSIEDLAKFNPTTGGLPLPRGTSLFGLDLRKTVIVPSYFPFWSRDAYTGGPESLASRSSIIKWTGNSFASQITFFDKVSSISVKEISSDDALNGAAILTALRPHGLNSNSEEVTLVYPEEVSQEYKGEQTVSQSGVYYASPIDEFRFYLRKDSSDGLLIQRTQLPEFPSAGSDPSEFLRFTLTLSTHHRLSAISFCPETELNNYYTKVQHAFGNLDFGNTFDNANVAPGESVIVNPVPTTPVAGTDTVKNGSPYIYNVSLRSNFGMCGLTHDGDKAGGFKSALSCNFTTVSLQNDPEVFEVYLSTQDRIGWFSLRQAAAFSGSVNVTEITDAEAIDYLINKVDLQHVRYFYRDAEDVLVGNIPFSSGLVDDRSDTRHYNTLCDNNSFTQIVSSFAIGPAVNYWARGGGRITVANANSNFGGQAIRSEGFSGIGTTGGSQAPDRGFTIQGVRCPVSLNKRDVSNPRNQVQLFLNTGIRSVDPTLHTITLNDPVDPSVVYPYTLKTGSAIWILDITAGVRIYSILEDFAGTSSPISSDGLQLQLSSTNDGITSISDPTVLSAPYIRRFEDPRNREERTYYLWIQNTSDTHRPPQSSFVARYSDQPQAGTERLILPGRQLDPGQSGGWNQTFTVAGALTKEDGDNPNIAPNQNIPSSRSSGGYYIALRLCDSFGPWIGGYELPENAPIGDTIPGVQQYARGSFSTSLGYNFYALNPELQVGANAVDPSAQGSNRWAPSKPYEYSQLTTDAFIPYDAYPASADPWTETYNESASYLRGVGVEKSSYFSRLVADEDDGTDDLGLGFVVSPTSGGPELTSSYAHSKLALARFIRLLGYSQDDIETLLVPRLATQRNVIVGSQSWPTFIPGEGNAESEGNWSLEFNQPSSVLSTNHTWEWAGYFNYTKGLPEYQSSPLSKRLRFDYILSESWGGVAIASGANESGEFILSGFTQVREDGRNILPDTPTSITDYSEYVLRAGDTMTGNLRVPNVITD